MPVSGLLPLVAAPAVMLTASAVEQHWGGRAAGYVTTAPYAVGIGVVVVSASQGPPAGAALALSAAGYVVAQLLCTALFALVARRRGRLAGLGVGVAGYVGCVCAEQLASPQAAVVVSAVAVVAAAALVSPRSRSATGRAPAPRLGYLVLAVRAAIGMIAVGLVIEMGQHTGPHVAGAVAAFPITTTTLALLTSAQRGVDPMTDVLFGSVRSIPAYLTFTGSYWLTATCGASVTASLTVATAGCLLTYAAIEHAPRLALRILW